MRTKEITTSNICRYAAARNVLTIAALVFVARLAFAGDLVPAGSPASTMKNLQEIYDQAAQANRAVGGGNALLFFPYLLERTGSVSDTQYTFDATIYLVATEPFAGQDLKNGNPQQDQKVVPNVTVNLYLYANNGQPATGAGGAPVANPASFELGPAAPKATVNLDTLFQNAGGFATSLFVGYAVLSISSGDWSDVSVEALLVNSHTGPADLEITPLKPVRVQNTQTPAFKGAAVTSELGKK